MESEFKGLLDREKHKKDVKKYFSAHIDVLVDMVNYGSWLIPRAYDSSQKKLEDAIIIGVLLKQVVTMIDSVEVLTSNATIYPAFLQSRAAFEASLFIDWIIKENSEKRQNIITFLIYETNVSGTYVLLKGHLNNKSLQTIFKNYLTT